MEFRVADAQNAQWNLQLAQPGIDVRTNNRIVGLINANQTRLRQLNDLQDSLRMTIQQRRKELADAEASYAEVVLAARQDLKRLRETLQPLIDHPQLAIALKVHATNHQTPPTVDLESLLGTVDRKLSQIEAEIFRETIPLEVSSVGALSVNVGINDQNIPMLLDGGAALTVLPADLARRLGVTVPADASPVRLVLADGKTLMARSAVIPTVRVGGFQAEKVAAAVLDPGSAITHPLLGMSFLGKFKFEIDSAAKELRLLRVAND
jgi:aspartyl protease family protein